MKSTLLLLLLLFIALHAACPQTPDFQKTETIIGTPVLYQNDVAVDTDGNLYILEQEGITKVNAAGEYLGEISIYGYKNSIEVDTAKNLYVALDNCSCIVKYDVHGNRLLTFGSSGSGAGQVKAYGRTALDAAGNLYVTDYTQKRVNMFNAQGEYVRQFGGTGTPAGPFPYIRDVGVDAQGNVYVLDASSGYETNTKTYKFSPSGELLKTMSTHQQGPGYNPNDVSSFVVRPDGGFYIVHDFYRRILEYDPEGNLIFAFAGHGGSAVDDTGLVGDLINLKLDVKGNIYASDRHSGSGSIKKFSPKGILLKKYGRDKAFSLPVYDRWDNLFVFDSNQKAIYKHDASGTLIAVFKPAQDTDNFRLDAKYLATDLKGNVYLLDYGVNGKQRIQKFDNNGKALQVFYTELPKVASGYSSMVTNFAIDDSGTMYIMDKTNSVIHKISHIGNYIGVFGKYGNGKGEISGAQSVGVDASGFVYVLDLVGHRIQKYTPSGQFIQAYGDSSLYADRNWGNLSVDDNGNAFVSYHGNYGSDLKIYNNKGELIKKLSLSNSGIGVNKRGNLLAAGSFIGIIRIHASDHLPGRRYITGTVFHDRNADCTQDKTEAPLSNILVAAQPGPFYGLSDEDGIYRIAVDPGTYTIHQVLQEESGRLISELCTSDNTGVNIMSGTTARGPDFANQVVLSPHLSVSVSSTRRRRCFESTTTVRYINSGFATATGAKVYVQLPGEVELRSADKTYSRTPDGTYEFTVGDLAAGQQGTITIEDMVTCGDESVRGRTVCTKAWITPDNKSPTAPPTAVSAVTGKCDANTGYVLFVVRNNGLAGMETGEQFRIYQDGKLATIENYKLAAGDSMVFRIPAMGRTIRLEADQPNGNGDNTLASATVEGCGAGGSPAVISTGFVNALPADDEEAGVAEDCLPIIDSYDPNDKLVTPAGLTEENFTPTGIALKYKIRFQNTGTDVAYRVVVVDTLSEHLDLGTLQLGTASHHYTYEVSGKGRPVLTWTFHSIMLPDSTSDEPGSHGYVQFSIKPKADLAEKTAVENFADIFFDYNSPVRTNVTVNRIYDMPLEIQEENRIVADEVVMTPTISTFSPASGKHGTEVVLTGLKFSSEPQVNKVYVNGVRAEVLEGNATTLKVRVPVGASTGALSVVTEHAGTSSTALFTVYQPPVIAGFSPAEGVVGAEVTLQGNHLASELIERVQLGSMDCEVLSTAQNTIRVRVPADAATGAFTVHTKGGTVQSGAAYRVWYAPSLTGFDKAMERVGGGLLLQGENFAPEPTRNTVLFGNVQAEVLQANAQKLEVRVPAGAASGTVSVTTPGGTASRAFEVIPAPVITAVYPDKGSVGTVVELQGKDFLTFGVMDTVLFSSVEAVVLSSSSTSFRVRVPRGAVTGKVSVAGVGGRDEADFEVEQLTPTQAIAVFPNPSTGKFIVDFTKADFSVEAVEVYDLTGKLLYTKKLDTGQSQQAEIELSGEKAGIFLVMLQTGRGKVVKKLTLL
ncbi:IPT/TIG domain-containing protein [Pontibacter toksunensis]|uniref:IPT/TIG domain-containing protein n=1 Tax=Pontibacter toksunensis TaxID=1332631 RepID=A0ABW6C3J3_9BACT